MLKKMLSGVCAGVLISIGGSVWLNCKDDNKFLAAILFTVALLCICLKGYSLFTGKVGFIPEKHGKEEFSVLFLGLLGNFLGTLLCGLVLRFSMADMAAVAETVCVGKLDRPLLSTFVRAVFCGILMYLAVSIFRDKKEIVAILFGIPVFILSGFEHSIADMFYLAVGGQFNVQALIFTVVVLLGNSVGGMLLPTLSGAWGTGERAK